MDLISNNNALTKDLLKEIKQEFNEEEQLVFANNFYMYLNYHPTEDFVIDLGDVYEMIGFTKLGNAKALLDKNFTENEDYKIMLISSQKQDSYEKWGGSNKQKVMLNTDTFKNLCMLARTEKAKKIRMYYVKLEKINMRILSKASEVQLEKQKMICRSEQIVEHYDRKPIVYLGLVEDTGDNQIIKYGHTEDIKSTLKRHKTTYGDDFIFVRAIESNNRREMEREIQNHRNLTKRHVKNYDGNPRQELLRLDKTFNLENLAELIYKLQKKKYTHEDIQEQEKTKQIEAQEKTKQMKIEFEEKTKQLKLELEEKTKQMQLELEARSKQIELEERTKQMEIELEMKKLDIELSRPKTVKEKKTREKDPEKERAKQLKKELLEEDRRIKKILDSEELEKEKKFQIRSIEKFIYHYAHETRDMDDLIEMTDVFDSFKQWVEDTYKKRLLFKYSTFLNHMRCNYPVKFSKKNGKGTAWLREFIVR